MERVTLSDIGPRQQPDPKAMRMLSNQSCLSTDAKDQGDEGAPATIVQERKEEEKSGDP